LKQSEGVSSERAKEMLETREQLIHALTHVAELEHSICCMYLFSAFSLKRSPEESISWAQTESNRERAATLLHIAREEMSHLAITCNLLTAIGGAPHLWRPNFPYGGRFYLWESRFELRPLSLEEIERYIQFEASESSSKISDSDYLTEAEATQSTPQRTIVTRYLEISSAFHEIDERTLFIGPPSSQLSIDFPYAVNPIRVCNRETALKAIDLVIKEGEHGPMSHLERLRKMRDALTAELEINPEFEPSRPIVCNPACHDDEGRGSTVITDLDTLAVMELFNDAYVTMLLMLLRISAHTEETAEELETLRSIVYFPLMTMVIRPLAEILTTLPVGATHPGLMAGPSFEVPQQLHLAPDKRVTWIRFQESLERLGQRCGELVKREVLGQRGNYLHENILRIGANFRRAMTFA
jgi:Ferritin-like